MNTRYNILYTSSFASLEGGGQRSTYLLIRSLDRTLFNPVLVVPEEGALARQVRGLGVTTHVVAFPRIRSLCIAPILRSCRHLARILHDEKIHLIHTESPRQTLYAAAARIGQSIPLVMHLRVAESRRSLDCLLSSLVDHFIAVSSDAASRFPGWERNTKLTVVYNGVELDSYRPGTRTSGGCLCVGYFGRIHPRKGLETLIAAAKTMREPVRVTIMGDGERPYVEGLKHMAHGAPVEFKGYQQDIRAALEEVDVVVLPCIRKEGLSRTILEAMSAGKIPVVSDFGSNREALGEELKEFVFPSGDAGALARILETVARNKAILHEKQGMVRQRAERLFDVKKKTAEIERVYRSLLAL